MLAADPANQADDAIPGTRGGPLSLVQWRDWRIRGGLLRIGDLVSSCALLVLTLPLMVIVALAVKLECAGPALVRSRRWIGGGRSVRAFSFRTIRYLPRAAGWLSGEALTPIGLFLRYTRIDELPQLLNVLRGDMSLFDRGRLRPDVFG
jgi:lipopolysaccharide/colanic/teichoic acid biosynthesis glycosyltransferase